MFNEAVLECMNNRTIDNSTGENQREIIRKIMVEPSLQGNYRYCRVEDARNYKNYNTTITISPIRKTMMMHDSNKM